MFCILEESLAAQVGLTSPSCSLRHTTNVSVMAKQRPTLLCVPLEQPSRNFIFLIAFLLWQLNKEVAKDTEAGAVEERDRLQTAELCSHSWDLL